MFSRVDPHVPSTSTAPQRRFQENLQKFKRFFPPNAPPTLWEVCSSKQRSKSLKNTFQTEVRALRGLNFTVLLNPYKNYLNDLTNLSGFTFDDLCQALRFFAFYRKQPVLKSNMEDANELFRLIASCIIYSNDNWRASIDKSTLVDTLSMNILEKQRLKNLKQESSEQKDPIYPPLFQDDELPSVPIQIGRLKDREKVPIPPPPCRNDFSMRQFNPLEDEHLRSMHLWNHVGCNDAKFNGPFERTIKMMSKNNVAIRSKDRRLSDVEYYGDNEDLPSTHISFRLDSVMQLINFDFPKIEDDGYFSKECLDSAWYLYENYQTALHECTTAFAVIRPPSGRTIKPGFVEDGLTTDECSEFHMMGRHIHGFFQVWREEDRGWRESNGKWVPRRYLVDIYNHIMFPLFVKWELWPSTLKWAFDKYSLYGLRLMSMIRRHPQELLNAGENLFSRYPSHLLESNRYDMSTTKGRNQYLSAIQMENNRVVDKHMHSSAYKLLIEEDGRRRKRKPKDEALLGVAAKVRTPRKVLEPPLFAPTRFISSSTPKQRALLVQKENLEKTMINQVPPVVNTPPSPQQTASQLKKTPTSATKRHLPEIEQELKSESVPAPPPTKKMSIIADSWDDHVGNSMEEEHVDEKDSEKMEDSEGRQNVWVPQDRGKEYAPEQYARDIIEHYIPAARDHPPQPQQPPPPLPTPKPPRRRKSGQKTDQTTPSSDAEASSDPAPPVPAAPVAPVVPIVPIVPVHPVPLPNGSVNTPKVKTIAKTTARVLYSIKPQIPPIANKTVYPVKKLTPSVVPSPMILNGNTATASPSKNAASVVVRNAYTFSLQQKAPYYPAGMRPKPTQNGIETPPTGAQSLMRAAFYSESHPTRSPLVPYGFVPPVATSSTFVPAATIPSPASRAIAHQKQMLLNTETCRRVMPFNIQMAFKPRRWDPLPKSSGVLAHSNSTIPYVQRVPNNSTQSDFRPRSFSQNSVASPAPAPVPNAIKRREVGNLKSRQYVPWIANSRALVAAAMATMEETAEKMSSSPLLSSQAPMTTLMPTPPPPAPAPAQASAQSTSATPALVDTISAGSTTTETTTGDSNQSNPPLRTYTSHIRKTPGTTLTPEEIGDAIRTESQRFQEDGDEGPTVKSFLMNIYK